MLVLQGNTATKLRCGGKFLILVISYFLLILAVKEFLKSTNICQSYSKNKSGTVFLTSQCSNRTLQTFNHFFYFIIFLNKSFPKSFGKSASPPSRQRMDSPAACASFAMPTVDESNHSAAVHYIHTAVRHASYKLHCTFLSPPPKKRNLFLP